MKTAVIYIGVGIDSGLPDEFFFKYGIEISLKCNVYNTTQLRNVAKIAFESNDGLIFIYSKSKWSDLQKVMLVEFERSSVFVDEKEPFVLAKGFKRFLDGVFFDFVYEKPVAFLPYNLKENLDASVVLSHFTSESALVKVFRCDIEKDKNLIYKDEVECIFSVQRKDVDKYEKLKGCYTTTGKSAEDALFDVLENKKVKIATAESCTSGLIAAKIANVPGVSAYLEGGAVTYSNKLKTNILKVQANILYNVGAVSEQTAKAMAVGAINLTNADFSIATTGIAGPGGATKDKQVGLVYIAAASKKGVVVEKVVFSGNRRIIREKSTRYSILLLREFILSQ
ncbi:CinA family protein [Hippea maritima]|uniref:CinA domain protein n=1 Tax=Hippea maritima (strain ATCC 700847 / DSM 10411 / MH2) TaxID=760142 RepID=F2LXN7_HIPMA|nr:CinA family protein [Hippea maritima]AEA33223.1 CinA domain protein [Hippea maritima DSM 10411]